MEFNEELLMLRMFRLRRFKRRAHVSLRSPVSPGESVLKERVQVVFTPSFALESKKTFMALTSEYRGQGLDSKMRDSGRELNIPTYEGSRDYGLNF